jgi:hypothetical protein
MDIAKAIEELRDAADDLRDDAYEEWPRTLDEIREMLIELLACCEEEPPDIDASNHYWQLGRIEGWYAAMKHMKGEAEG